MTPKLEDIVERAVTVVSLPDVYQRLIEVMNHPRSGAQDIARVLKQDPGLAARILRIVNSALFSFPQRIESVAHAVTVVGTSQIRDLALATSLVTAFTRVPEELVTMRSFWRHSIGGAVGARTLASYRREQNVERFFLAGLLHDVGKLVIYQYESDAAREALEWSRERERPSFEGERQVLGFDHASVGRALLTAWNLPAVLTEAVASHHFPHTARFFPVEAAAVHVGDIISIGLGLGSSGECRVPSLDSNAWTTLGLDGGSCENLLADVQKQVEAAEYLLEVVEA